MQVNALHYSADAHETKEIGVLYESCAVHYRFFFLFCTSASGPGFLSVVCNLQWQLYGQCYTIP